MSCEFTPQASAHATERTSTPPTLTAAEVEARELAETLAQERLWMAWLLAGAGVVVVASFSLGYLTAALSLG
ncbi:MAG: hypothetical protein WBK26_15220 [Burkholderiaceae bacterium]